MPIPGSKGALLGRLFLAYAPGVGSGKQISAVRMDFDIAHGRKPASASLIPIKKAHLWITKAATLSKILTFASSVEPDPIKFHHFRRL
jgi:hypothetical protein